MRVLRLVFHESIILEQRFDELVNERPMTLATAYLLFATMISVVAVALGRASNGSNGWAWLSTALPIALVLGTACYNAFDRFHFFINRSTATLRGKRVTFNASSRFEVLETDHRSLLEKCVEALDREFPRSKLRHISGLQADYELNGKTLWIQIVPPDDFDPMDIDCLTDLPATEVLFRITGGNASYFGMGNAVSEYNLHIQSLRDAIHSGVESHSLEILFDEDNNPYFGLYLKKVRPVNIKQFLCEIENGAGDTQTFIAITHDKISFDSRTPQALFHAAQKYLNAPSTRQITDS